jgi:hypothetical protein
VQFPLNFSVITNNSEMVPGLYIIQLHIYKLPRGNYDLPLWSADKNVVLQESIEDNLVDLIAYSDRR